MCSASNAQAEKTTTTFLACFASNAIARAKEAETPDRRRLSRQTGKGSCKASRSTGSWSISFEPLKPVAHGCRMHGGLECDGLCKVDVHGVDR